MRIVHCGSQAWSKTGEHDSSCTLLDCPDRIRGKGAEQVQQVQEVPRQVKQRTCRASTAGGRTDFFMWPQAWNCWLMHTRKTKVAMKQLRADGKPSQVAAASHAALKGIVTTQTCSTSGISGHLPTPWGGKV